MNELNIVKKCEVPNIKIWNNQRVVTFKDIDEAHQRPCGTAKRNFNKNRKYFIENEDFYKITLDEFRMFESQGDDFRTLENIRAEDIGKTGLMLFTETGYLMLVKSFRDDLSWSVQRRLVNGYFRGRKLEEQPETQAMQVQKITEERKKLQNKVEKIAKQQNLKTKQVTRKIMLELGKNHNLETAKAQYRNTFGFDPPYAMDLIEAFPELMKQSEEIAEAMMEKSAAFEKSVIESEKVFLNW